MTNTTSQPRALYWHQHLLRNVFDQYEHLENRLTHALFQTLATDATLLDWMINVATGDLHSKKGQVILSTQMLPDSNRADLFNEPPAGNQGIPDGWIYDRDYRWAILFECKIQAGLSLSQLRRHVATARRRGFENIFMIVLTADRREPSLISRAVAFAPTRWLSWRDLYLQLQSIATPPTLALADYMAVVEERQGGVTLTQFTGIQFDRDQPYTYQKAKEHLRNLKHHLVQKLTESTIFHITPETGRKAITDDAWGIWDYISFAKSYTFPHLTIWIAREATGVQFTLPNAAPLKYWLRLGSLEVDGVKELLVEIHSRAARLRRKTKQGFEPKVQVSLDIQHFYARRIERKDGGIAFNIDCIVEDKDRIDPSVKTVKSWPAALHDLLQAKRHVNMQFNLSIEFDYDNDSVVRTPQFADHLVQAAYAFEPIYRYLMGEQQEASHGLPLLT